jgi:hypothetical protein
MPPSDSDIPRTLRMAVLSACEQTNLDKLDTGAE